MNDPLGILEEFAERAHTAAMFDPEVPDWVRPWLPGSGRSPETSRENGRKRSPLTADQVLDIRKSSESQRILAKQYGVGKTTIQRIRSGAAWADLRG